MICRRAFAAATFVVVLIFALGIAQAALTPAQVTNTRLFLLEFPQEFPNQLSSWTGADYCVWSGVICDANGYVTVDLSNRGLTGEMPEVESSHVDGSQVMILRIDMSHNNGLKGSFESNWGLLTELQELDLSYTSLDDNLPNEWSQLTNLNTLIISNTGACKSLPQWTMPALTYVDLSNNRMTGALMGEWSQMTSLQTVNLAGNNFCGCVPSSWSGNTVLTNAISSYTAVTAGTCNTDNACTISRLACDKKNGALRSAIYAVPMLFLAFTVFLAFTA